MYYEFFLMSAGKKIYFLSDSHLGVPNPELSRYREKQMVKWFDAHSSSAEAIYLLGDIFDFWFEYKKVVPKGFVRLFGKIATITDQGVPVHFFSGNHDMWVFDYFENELGVIIHKQPIVTTLFDKRFMIGHGDGLGPGDHAYKFMKRVFSCKVCQKLFSFLHPGFGVGLAQYFSQKSRIANNRKPELFKGEDRELLVHYCKEIIKTQHIDYFVFGHRHLPLKIEIQPGTYYINTGEWLKEFSFASFDGKTMALNHYKPDEIKSSAKETV